MKFGSVIQLTHNINIDFPFFSFWLRVERGGFFENQLAKYFSLWQPVGMFDIIESKMTLFHLTYSGAGQRAQHTSYSGPPTPCFIESGKYFQTDTEAREQCSGWGMPFCLHSMKQGSIQQTNHCLCALCVLQDSLGGNARTSIVACVHPDAK